MVDQATVPNQQADAENEEFYDLLKLFADTLDQVERNYVNPVDRRVLIEGAIEGVLSKLDPYSDYISPEDLERFRNSVESEYGGIGIQVDVFEGQLTISSSIVGGPAYRAGLMAGDKIVKIGDESTEGITRASAVEKLKGPLGTKITFTVQQPDRSQTETVTLSREVVRVDTVVGDHRRSDHSWEFMLDPEKKIGYVRLTAFSRQTAEELRKAVQNLLDQEMKGLILDLRDNPGGLLSSAIEVADLFVAKGRIVSTSGRAAPERTWDAREEGTLAGFSLAVLVNNYSASASEIVAACLQDHQCAAIIGQRTWGKGSVQNVIDLEDGRSALKLTTAGYQRPSGKNIHRFPGASEDDAWGVQPDAEMMVTLTPSEFRQLREYRKQHDVARRPGSVSEVSGLPKMIDPQLQRALTYLDERLGYSQNATAQAQSNAD
jgi:carboxyl-terminal processing protease